MSRVRVLEVLGRSAGGVARHVAEVVEGLHGVEGFEVEAAGPPDLPVPIPRLKHHITIPDGALRGHRAAVGRLRTAVQEGGYDVVHAHGLRAAVDSVLATRRGGPRVLVTLHNLALPTDAVLRRLLQRRAESFVISRAERVLAPSLQIAEHLRAHSPRGAEKVHVFHVAVPEPSEPRRTREEVRAEFDVSPEAPLILSVARLAPQKDLPTLLRAMRDVDQATLLIIGEGPQESDLRALTTELGLGDRVCFAGWRRDVYDCMRAADVLCLSSVWEGVALAAQEAAAVCTPIVSTDVGGIRELIEDGVSGRLVSPRDPASLAKALQEVLSSRDLARSYAERAFERLRSDFDKTVMLKALRELYRGPGV